MLGVEILLPGIILIVGLVMLVKGADIFIDAASAVALRFGVSQLVIGLTIVAIGTSAPEFAVSGFAAWDGSGDISLANVVGSNIFNLGFILAMCAIASPIVVKKQLVYRDGSFLFGATLLLTLFVSSDSTVTRWEGVILFFVLGLYLTMVWRDKSHANEATGSEVNTENPVGSKTVWFFLLIGLSLLLVGSQLVVNNAQILARQIGMSEWLIGISVIAVGTSLPELVTAMASLRKQKEDIGIGGLIGSDLFNILGVVGFSSLVAPIQSTSSFSALAFLIVTVGITLVFLRSNWRLTRPEGCFLLVGASLRFAYEFIA